MATLCAKFPSIKRSYFEQNHIQLFHTIMSTWRSKKPHRKSQENANIWGGHIKRWLDQGGGRKHPMNAEPGLPGRILRCDGLKKFLWGGDKHTWLKEGMWSLWPGQMMIGRLTTQSRLPRTFSVVFRSTRLIYRMQSEPIARILVAVQTGCGHWPRRG